MASKTPSADSAELRTVASYINNVLQKESAAELAETSGV
jgi:hypothetical protein